jgi:hypothetical protein
MTTSKQKQEYMGFFVTNTPELHELVLISCHVLMSIKDDILGSISGSVLAPICDIVAFGGFVRALLGTLLSILSFVDLYDAFGFLFS